MIKSNTYIIVFITLVLLMACHPELLIKGPKYDYSNMDEPAIRVHKQVERFVVDCQQNKYPIDIHPSTRIDTVIVDKKSQYIDVKFTKHFSYIPIREENVVSVYKSVRNYLGSKFKNYKITLWSLDQPIQQLIPNYYRSSRNTFDLSRMPISQGPRLIKPIVRRIGDWVPSRGLYNRNIGLWHSHGWYYSILKDRWEWQRPRLFQTVEDLLPMSFTLPYLIPMLENAGAQVFVPRERDTQINEVVVDNDSVRTNMGQYHEQGSNNENFIWYNGIEKGFALGTPPYPLNHNPFRQGTYRETTSDTITSASIEWIPNIPEDGEYAVYVSYFASEKNIDDALYSVYHAGGRTQFLVNQQIGGQTWVYLGRFKFFAGVKTESGKVTLSNYSEQPGKIVTADAVRFGGGSGNIMRNGRISGRPRFEEGSRYYLQYAGFPDTLVYNFNNNKNDYNDDYQSRAEFVNYLKGAPSGPNINRDIPGLGIPVDLSFAFHTDAGITQNDTAIGTLMIYSITDADTQMVFPDGVSRLANRDLGDILQTQLIRDIKLTFDPKWNRRRLMEAQYSEAYRPNVPGVLLELLSHQNFLDMRFAQDPRFKFLVSRSIYKGMLKFINFQNGQDYMVQPLPVSHFQTEFDSLGNILLEWQPQNDPLEPTAVPEEYRVYTRINDGGFDNGFIVDRPKTIIYNVEPGLIYSFKITALNSGGESFPSEILSVYKINNKEKPILIISGFDRICGPATVEGRDLSGFVNFVDQGVPDKFDINFTGQQFDFDPNSVFRLNDAPGHGSSYADYETKIIPGNTFDFAFVHGQSIKAAGYSFVTCSDEAVADGYINLKNYEIVDWILGEEKETSWPKSEMDSLLGKQFKTFDANVQIKLEKYVNNGGHIFVSGAYVGSDLFAAKPEKHPDKDFARNVLKFWWVTDHAARNGNVFSVDATLFGVEFELLYNSEYNPNIYTVEAPDALGPEEGAKVILRYSENQFSAGIAYEGDYKTVVLGFPFESIISKVERDKLMRSIVHYFTL